MSARLEGIDRTVQVTHAWINELDERLGWNNKHLTYRLLKAVLHAVRDWLPVNESANLAAQLPTLLRGVYYEQWRPAACPEKQRSMPHFIRRIDRAVDRNPPIDLVQAVRVTFNFLRDRISDGEIEDVRRGFRADLRDLWPAA